MLTLRHYIFIGILVFVSVLLANVPAKLVYDAIDSQLSLNSIPELKGGEVQGTVWKGRMAFEYSGQPAEVFWDVMQVQFLRGRLVLQVSVITGNAKDELEGKLFISLFGAYGFSELNGLLRDQLVNRLAKNQFSIEENITLDSVGITFQDRNFASAQGKIKWPGGQIRYFDPSRGPQNVALPALTATISEKEGTLTAALFPEGKDDLLVSINVDGDGEAEILVRKRLLDLIGQRWGAAVSPDKVVFQVQQNVF